MYDGTHSRKLKEGNGVTADLFIKNGITVYTEENFLDKIKLDDKWIEQTFLQMHIKYILKLLLTVYIIIKLH